MEGNQLTTASDNIWYIVGKHFDPFLRLAQVTTFEGFLFGLFQTKNRNAPCIGILGQGLSPLEVKCLFAVQAYFPGLRLLATYDTPSALDINQAPFSIDRLLKVGHSHYQGQLNIRQSMPTSSCRLPISILMESGKQLLENVIQEELNARCYEVIIKQATCHEKNALFPLDTKIDCFIKDVQLKKQCFHVKATLRFYQAGKVGFECQFMTEITLTEELKHQEAKLASKTLQDAARWLEVEC